MKTVFPLFVLLLVTQAVLAQESFSTIEERMTGKEFSAAGLSKLTPEELSALNEWLRSHSVATLDTARNTGSPQGDMRGLEWQMFDDMDDSAIVSRIKGPFQGWVGDGTIIELENGMIWKTTERSQFNIPPTEGLVAEIDKGMFGGWRLQVEGYNKSVRVERIQQWRRSPATPAVQVTAGPGSPPIPTSTIRTRPETAS